MTTVCGTYPCLRTSAGCPVCDRTPIYNMPAPPTFTPMGCICPPTSEKTCESICCPRKNPFKGMQGAAIAPADRGPGVGSK